MPEFTCQLRTVTAERWADAIRKAAEINPHNAPGRSLRGLDLETPLVARDNRLAVDVKRYWGRKGVRLTVGFLDRTDAELRRRILAHMNAWNQTANVQFVATDTDPQVRISRADDGCWSQLGTDILGTPRH